MVAGLFKGRTIFPGWFVVAACFVVMASLGEAFYSFSVFVKPLEEEFGWSRALIASGYTVFIVGYAISNVIGGRLADRHDPRFVLLPASVLVGFGTSLASLINSVFHLWLFMFIIGLGAGATFSVPTSAVQRWFRNRKGSGTALALIIVGTGVGALVFAPLVNSFVLSYGWRNAYLLTGIIFFVLTFTASFAIRPAPTEIVVRTDGAASKTGPKLANVTGFSTRQVLTTPGYGSIIYAYFIAAVAFNVVSAHLVPYSTDIGMSSTAGAAALGLMGGVSIPGRLASGFLANRITWQKVLAIALFGMAISTIWLIFMNSAWMLYSFVFLFGIFHGMRVVAMVGVLGEFFGMRSLGEIIGISSGLSNLLSAIAPYIAGFIYDTTGSYFVGFAIMAALVAAGGMVIMLVKKPSLAAK